MSPAIPLPMFDIDKEVKEIIEETKLTQGFEKYGVCLTDVSKDHVDWKYKSQGKLIF